MSYLNQILAKHFLPRKPRDRCRLVVPLVHKALSVDAEDRSVRRVDESLQLLRYASLLDFDLLPLRDVLPYANHPHDITTDISPRRCVEQHLHALSFLGIQGEFEIRRLAACQSVIEHLFDADLVLLSDEVLQIECYKIAKSKNNVCISR